MKKLFIMALATVLMGSTAMAQENNSEKKWGQTYAYTGYIDLLNPESNPL